MCVLLEFAVISKNNKKYPVSVMSPEVEENTLRVYYFVRSKSSFSFKRLTNYF